MMFWQLTIDANDPARLAPFWSQALDYRPAPPDEPDTTWYAHYRARLGSEQALPDRLFDPDDPSYFVVMQDPEGNEFCVS